MRDSKPPGDLFEVLSSLVRWFNHQKVPYTLIGGVAVGLVAQPRATLDVDAVVWMDLAEAASFIESAEKFGFEARVADAIGFVRTNRVLLLRHRESKIGIDVSFGILPFEREMLDRALPIDIGDTVVKVATPEDLIILKAVAHRKRDLIDIDNLLDVYPDVDRSRLQYWIRQFAEALEAPEILKDFERLIENRGVRR